MRSVAACLIALSVCIPVTQSVPDAQAIARNIEQELAAAKVPGAGIAVVVGDAVVSGSYGVADQERGPAMTTSTLLHVGSINKMFTALAVVSALEAHKIPRSSPVGKYLVGLSPQVGALTFHQLLSQTSGLRDIAGDDGRSDEAALAAVARALTAKDFVVPAGTVFSYSNPGYALAGAALEAIAKRPFADALREAVFLPLGMQSTSVRVSDVRRTPMAAGHRLDGPTMTAVRTPSNDTALWPAGYLWTNAEDMSRALALFAGAERIGGSSVTNLPAVRLMTTPQTPMPNVFVGGHYGYGLMIATDRGTRIVEHGGTQTGFSSILRVAPDQRVGVAILSNLDNAPLRRIAQAVMDKALGLAATPAAARIETPVTLDEVRPLLGVYRNRGTAELAIRDGRVVLILDGGPAMAVSRIGDDRFLARPRPDLAGPEFVLRAGYLHFALWAYGR